MNRLLCIGVIFVSSWRVSAEETGKEVDPDAQALLLQNIRKTAAKLESLSFSGEIHRSKWNIATHKWEETPIYRRFTVTRSGPASDQARLDYEKSITERVDGAAPYFEEVYSVAFVRDERDGSAKFLH